MCIRRPQLLTGFIASMPHSNHTRLVQFWIISAAVFVVNLSHTANSVDG